MGTEEIASDAPRLRAELGFVRWEAIGHFLSDGDFFGFNQGHYPEAIAEYEKAWELLSTPWQQKSGGAYILRGIADFALISEDSTLAAEVLASLLPRAFQVECAELHIGLGKLALLASKPDIAIEQFRRAFELGGSKAFAEPDGPYLAMIERG